MPVLSHQNLVKIIRGVRPIISGAVPITDDQIQMASLDLMLGDQVYGMRAAALPRHGQKVAGLIDELAKYSFALTPDEDKLLLRGQTYIVPLNEVVNLPKGFSAQVSPKSSTGRLDVFVRLLVDGSASFDRVPEEYSGPLFLEITPLSFDVLLRAGQKLVQMRIKKDGPSYISGTDVRILHSDKGIVWNKKGKAAYAHELIVDDRGLFLHIDLERTVIGFKARVPARREIAFSKENSYEPDDFWIPIHRPEDGSIIINPGEFYLLATLERMKIPGSVCGDIAAYDASAGEFRSHYAGFFDPGFGERAKSGTVGVMEVRGREIPFRLMHGQRICRMDFERMDEVPDVLYGATSHYTGSGASLSKFFRKREEVWQE